MTMGTRYEQHSDMCGCERCAREYERENPRPVFDAIEDPEYCSFCGFHLSYCTCADDDGYDGEDADDPDLKERSQ